MTNQKKGQEPRKSQMLPEKETGKDAAQAKNFKKQGNGDINNKQGVKIEDMDDSCSPGSCSTS